MVTFDTDGQDARPRKVWKGHAGGLERPEGATRERIAKKMQGENGKSIAQRIGQVESDVLDAADAIKGFAAIDFNLVRDDLAEGVKTVFFKGEEMVLRDAAAELSAIFHEITASQNEQ